MGGGISKFRFEESSANAKKKEEDGWIEKVI
jgi:hypothetical protein